MRLAGDRGARARVPDVLAEGMTGVAPIRHDPSASGRSVLEEAAADGSRGRARPATGPAGSGVGQLVRLPRGDPERDGATARSATTTALVP